MKVTKVVLISSVLAGLALLTVFATPCKAQAEVSPDVYDATNSTVAAPAQLAMNQHASGEFQGSFVLASAVECSGRKLEAGRYTVSLNPAAFDRKVTLVHNGHTIRVRANQLALYSGPGENVVLVRQAKQGRSLDAIYLTNLNLALYFHQDGIAFWASNLTGAERIPIS